VIFVFIPHGCYQPSLYLLRLCGVLHGQRSSFETTRILSGVEFVVNVVTGQDRR